MFFLFVFVLIKSTIRHILFDDIPGLKSSIGHEVFFNFYFVEEMLALISEGTNKFATQTNVTKWKDTSYAELLNTKSFQRIRDTLRFSRSY